MNERFNTRKIDMSNRLNTDTLLYGFLRPAGKAHTIYRMGRSRPSFLSKLNHAVFVSRNRIEAHRLCASSADLTPPPKNPKLCAHSRRAGASRGIEANSMATKLSARNRIEGKIVELQLGGVMGHVTVQAGKNLIESVITKRSVEEMKLKVGDRVTAVIKSTEVMLEKD
jgi:molybdopterin-binding protein